jgi:hypothetical protein
MELSVCTGLWLYGEILECGVIGFEGYTLVEFFENVCRSVDFFPCESKKGNTFCFLFDGL